jgi:hypothetical protein
VLFKAKLLNDFTKFLNLPENKALVGKAFGGNRKTVE